MSIVAITEICFGEVRSFEAFTYLHVGIISDIKRKTLPAIAELTGLENALLITSLSHPITLGSAGFKKAKARINLRNC